MIASIIPKLLSTYFIGRLGFLLLENGIVGISIVVIWFGFSNGTDTSNHTGSSAQSGQK